MCCVFRECMRHACLARRVYSSEKLRQKDIYRCCPSGIVVVVGRGWVGVGEVRLMAMFRIWPFWLDENLAVTLTTLARV